MDILSTTPEVPVPRYLGLVEIHEFLNPFEVVDPSVSPDDHCGVLVVVLTGDGDVPFRVYSEVLMRDNIRSEPIGVELPFAELAHVEDVVASNLNCVGPLS